MELKVWVDGVQRVVCGVTEATTCQEVVIALAQAIGRTGRYTLVEKWRDTERHLAPNESPVASLNTWGQYAGDVQLVLHRTGPSLTERPPSEGPPLRGPERGLHRQSLPPLAKLRHYNHEHSLRRREPRRKSLTFTGTPRSLRDILTGARLPDSGAPDSGAESRFLKGAGHDTAPAPNVWACRVEELMRLLQLQRETLSVLQRKLESYEAAYEAELHVWEEARRRRRSSGELCEGLTEEILRLEKHLRKTEVETEEEEFWASELHIEQESERQLQERLQELRVRLQGCERQIHDKISVVQEVEEGLQEEQEQREKQEAQWVTAAEARAQVLRVKTELRAQERQAVQLEGSCRALDRALGQSSRKLQDMQTDLELLTKELRQVNLQQFIRQTGSKVTVLPAEPTEDEGAPTSRGIDLVPLGGSLKRPSPGHLRVLQSPLSSGLNPEGIYV
ncbi:unnamed protein product [Knipowitschia caucasica]|uniref:Ras-associating domain-containing protein n=1 Tax=Knipowitschia caucasica TaxID=637954 RepID=A0AAV2L3K1_KNICA